MAISFYKKANNSLSSIADSKRNRTIGSALTGRQLDQRLEKAIKGEEPFISSSEALAKIRRLRL